MYVPAHRGDEGNEAADALARGAVARVLAGKPVTETIGVPQHLGADVSYSCLEHRARTATQILAKIGGFGPVVAICSTGSQITQVRGCLVSKLEDVSGGQILILETCGARMTIKKLVDLTVQVGESVVDIVAAVNDGLPIPLVLGRDWMKTVPSFFTGIDEHDIKKDIVFVNGRVLEPSPIVPYSPGGKKFGFIPSCRIVRQS